MFRGDLLRFGAIVYLLHALVLPLNAQLSQAGIVSGSVATRDGSHLNAVSCSSCPSPQPQTMNGSGGADNARLYRPSNFAPVGIQL
jgi:hypothetical protein